MQNCIQGIRLFHHQVQEYYEHSSRRVFVFEELVNSLLSGRAEQAVMAIENSIAGPIIPNYALIDKHNLHIIEHYLRIHQNLALKGQTIEDIVEVHRIRWVAMYGLLKSIQNKISR
jgi:prephenate dehydratase